jgi:serine/threonine-protein kinase
MIGSPLYMSPEQARGDVKNIDHRTDIWSLGIVLYQTLCGRTPYQDATALGELIIAICSQFPRNIQEVAPWVPAPIAAIVHRCLRHNREERFESADEMFLACKSVLTSGWAIGEEMIVSLADTNRKEAEHKYALTNVLSGAQTALVPHAGAGTVGALTSSQLVTVPPPPPRDNRVAMAFTAVAVLGIGGLGVYWATRPPPPAPIPAFTAMPTAVPTPPPVEPKPVVSASPIEVSPASGDSAVRRVKVVIAPLDANIELDGAKATLNKQGLLEISGKLGSNHRVTLTKGKNETTTDVAITEDGPSVPKIEILPPGVKPAATPSTTAGPTAPPSGIITKFEIE